LLHRLAFSTTDWNLHIVRASSDDEGVDNDHYLYASSSTTVFRWKMNITNNLPYCSGKRPELDHCQHEC
jgi:hypothetical protein